MKNKTHYKKQNQVTKTLIVTIAAFTLFLAGCFDFENIYQPYHAEPNAYFDVQISAWTDTESVSQARFGALLPVGWVPQDSIVYFDSTSSFIGTLIYSESFSQSMSSIDPPPDNYYWWVAEDAVNIGGSTYNFDLRIYTDAQTGDFFIDYMLGSNATGLNYTRSNDHLIIIGDIQGCAPEGISLTTQAEVDSFQMNYPGCSHVAGDISISGSDITNLNGLNGLTQIGGSLWMKNNDNLLALNGLNDLASIGGSFYFTGNPFVASFSGLNNLTEIGRDFEVDTNQLLVDFSGLGSLASVGRSFRIILNSSLESMSGLDNMNSIGGNLIIGEYYLGSNPALSSLAGLENLVSIGGDFRIYDNDALISITGLENLSSIGGNFSVGSKNALTNLTGLENVSSIGGYLSIYNNNALTSLTGLNNVTSIGGYLIVYDNGTLTSLTGLNNLISIGGYLYVYGNDTLTSFTGLNNLTSIGESLYVSGNDALTSLTGLENIEPDSITDLTITNNNLLSECHVLSVCNYLGNPNGAIEIHDNAEGCNDTAQVNAACLGVSIEEIMDEYDFVISPNPINGLATLSYNTDQVGTATIEIYNTMGSCIQSRQLKIDKAGQQHLLMDFTGFPSGMYLFIAQIGDRVVAKKIIKQ